MPDFYGSEELLVLVLGIFAALTIMLGISYFKSMQRPVPAGYLADHPNDTIFVFADHELVDASPSALIYLEDPLNRHSAWQRLMQKSNRCPLWLKTG